MASIWEKELKRPQYEKLTDNLKTDVLIIGGGIAGLLCAYKMQEAGIDCVVAEAERICSGTTADTTAKISSQHGLIYSRIIKEYGLEYAKLYMEAQKDAQEQYKILCAEYGCHLESEASYVYSLDDPGKITGEAEALGRIGCEVLYAESLPLPLKISGAVGIPGQYQFNPLELLYPVSKKLKIFENTKVIGLKPGKAVTECAEIKADNIIVATHFPFLNKHGSYFLKMYQHRSYVSVYENAPILNGMYVDENEKGMSFRRYKNLLIAGGGGHRTGKKGGGWKEVSDFIKRNYPDSKEVCSFATQDCMTLDGIPYIGKYSSGTSNLYVSTGFNKWGMTSAMISAMILSDLVRNKKNKYSRVFSPSRSILHPQLAINVFEAAAGLLIPTTPRCSHMGCRLTYNPAEHSWDCSCHGSRFDESGKVIDNPANKDI